MTAPLCQLRVGCETLPKSFSVTNRQHFFSFSVLSVYEQLISILSNNSTFGKDTSEFKWLSHISNNRRNKPLRAFVQIVASRPNLLDSRLLVIVHCNTSICNGS